jgi:hypothetical protein
MPTNQKEQLPQDIDAMPPDRYIVYRRSLLRNRGGRLATYVSPNFYGTSGSDTNASKSSNALKKDSTVETNLDTNMLRRLPPEIILIVSESLGPPDFLVLCATCHWIREVLQSLVTSILQDTIFDPSVTYHNLDQRPGRNIYYGPLDDLAVRYHRDRFVKLAAIEDYGKADLQRPDQELLCGYCFEFHPLSSFSVE